MFSCEEKEKENEEYYGDPMMFMHIDSNNPLEIRIH